MMLSILDESIGAAVGGLIGEKGFAGKLSKLNIPTLTLFFTGRHC